MLDILSLSSKVIKIAGKHHIEAKLKKQLDYLKTNPLHPSLHVELLEPKQYGIYSFRIDRKNRALFFYRPDNNAIELINITVHYH